MYLVQRVKISAMQPNPMPGKRQPKLKENAEQVKEENRPSLSLQFGGSSTLHEADGDAFACVRHAIASQNLVKLLASQES
jgi:hypothetical protein